jgi:sugar phosphate isomerase/epimerase
MRVGLTSYAFRWAIEGRGMPDDVPMEPTQFLDKAAHLGAEVVQICDNLPLDSLSPSQLAWVARRGTELDLTIELGIRGSRPDHLRRNLAVARSLGARVLRVVLSAPGWEPGADEIISLLRALVPELRAAGVTLAIENRFRFAPRALAEIVRRIDDPAVRICVDPLNSVANLIGPSEVISVLAPLAVTAHAKDAVVHRPSAGLYIVGCPLGQGLVDLPGMVEALRAGGQCESVLAEGWMDPLDDPAATLAQEEAWAHHGVAYLHSLLQAADCQTGNRRPTSRAKEDE